MPHSAAQPRQDDKLAAALALARYGFDVFPLRPYIHPGPNATPEAITAAEKDAKKPLIENWQNLATNDEARVTAWWRQHPNANIGISTQGLLVIDVDPWKGGKETFEDLARSGALIGEDFPPTLAVGTQSGGTHCFYCLPPKTAAKGGVNKLGPGIDVKAHGGYVVGAGSTIGEKSYAWKKGYEPNKRELAEAPRWLIDKCNAPRPKSAEAGKVVILEDEIAIRHARQWMEQNAPHARIGERGYTAFKVACRFYDYGVSKETCIELLIDWSEEYCEAPMDRDDIEHAAYSAQVNRDNAIGSKHPGAPGFEPYEMPERAPAKKPEAKPDKRSRFYAVRADAGATKALENIGEPLIKGVIHRGAMSVLIGAPGGGKTFFVLDWCYHIAKGLPWAGRPTHQGAVVYLAAEAGTMIMARLAALQAHYGPLGDVPLYVVPCSADFAHGEEDAAAIAKLIQDVERDSGQKVELFVVDTLNRAISGGDENSSKDVGALIRNVDRIREVAKTHALIIHHPGKDESKGGRGHSSVLGGTDTEMVISNHTLTFTKQRDMPLGDPIGFTLKPIRIGVDAEGEEVTSCYVVARKPGEAPERVALQPHLEELLSELEEQIESDKRDNPDMDGRFGWQVAGECLGRIQARQGFRQTVVRTTVQSMLTELTEKGWLRKTGRNQWVKCNAENAENAENLLG